MTTRARATPLPDKPRFSAIILAGDRRPADPLVLKAGVAGKALIPVSGIPMVQRVVSALAGSRFIGRRILCGPPRDALKTAPRLLDMIQAGEVEWMESQPSPCLSAIHAMARIPDTEPVLLTTADHALLSTEILDEFCRHVLDHDHDVVAGLARYEDILRAYPETNRTALRFRDGAFSGCNLFAFPTPAGRRITAFWRRVEQQRKNPFRVVSAAGWMAVLRYALGRLTLEEGLHRISRRLDLRVGVAVLSQPEAAIDIDTVEDWKLADKIARERP